MLHRLSISFFDGRKVRSWPLDLCVCCHVSNPICDCLWKRTNVEVDRRPMNWSTEGADAIGRPCRTTSQPSFRGRKPEGRYRQLALRQPGEEVLLCYELLEQAFTVGHCSTFNDLPQMGESRCSDEDGKAPLASDIAYQRGTSKLEGALIEPPRVNTLQPQPVPDDTPCYCACDDALMLHLLLCPLGDYVPEPIALDVLG